MVMMMIMVSMIKSTNTNTHTEGLFCFLLKFFSIFNFKLSTKKKYRMLDSRFVVVIVTNFEKTKTFGSLFSLAIFSQTNSLIFYG